MRNRKSELRKKRDSILQPPPQTVSNCVLTVSSPLPVVSNTVLNSESSLVASIPYLLCSVHSLQSLNERLKTSNLLPSSIAEYLHVLCTKLYCIDWGTSFPSKAHSFYLGVRRGLFLMWALMWMQSWNGRFLFKAKCLQIFQTPCMRFHLLSLPCHSWEI